MVIYSRCSDNHPPRSCHIIRFPLAGRLNSIILAAIIGIIGGVTSISLGIIIASFAKNPPQVSQLGTLIAIPVSFLVGAFFQLPQVLLILSLGIKFRYTPLSHGIK